MICLRRPRGLAVLCLILLLAACGGSRTAPSATATAAALPTGTPVGAAPGASPTMPVAPPVSPIRAATPAPPAATPAQAPPTPPAPKHGKGFPAPTAPPGPTAASRVRPTVQPLPHDTDRSAAVAFADANHGWLAAGATILATTDGGRHWARQYAAADRVASLSFISARRGWAATAGGLLATADGGATWRDVALGATAPVTRVAFADAGHGWVAVRDAPRDGQPHTDRLLRTTDGGATWRPVTDPCPPYSDRDPFSFTGPDTGWLICGTYTTMRRAEKWLYRTGDGGEHWALVAAITFNAAPPVPRTLPPEGAVTDLDFLDDRHGWLTTTEGLAATTDGGQTWRDVRADLPLGQPIGWMQSVRFLSPQRGYLLFAGYLLATRDGGATWANLDPAPLLPTARWSAYQFFDGDDGVAAGTVLDTGAVLRTADGGQTWRQVGSVGGDTPIVALSFSDPRHGWAVTDTTLYRTADGGATWAPLPAAARAARLIAGACITLVDAGTGYIARCRQGGGAQLYVTHDGGATFQPIGPFEDHIADFAFADERNGWKLVNGRLFATVDGGATWAPVPVGYRVVEFGLRAGGRAWVVALDQGKPYFLATTADGGLTWTRYDFAAIIPEAAFFADASHGWLWSVAGRLYRTTDGGRTWTELYAWQFTPAQP
ncbi:MAG TPA: YCF48-related protein [Thermomicrobiales bacterium]|nr:YCF48-related protein [Thermomicrobiales bacterium]